MSDLKSKAVTGIKWSFVDNLANSGLTFLFGIILARLLSPKEFGIIGIITIFISISNIIVEGGLSTALIRKNKCTYEDYCTVFFTNLFISIFFYFLLIVFNKSIAFFFNEEILLDIMPVMGGLLLISSFTIIQRTILTKKVDFKTQAKISITSSLSSGILGITLALCHWGIWSLVAMQLARQLVIAIMLWCFSSWKPAFLFSKSSFKELFTFSYKVLLANIVNTLYQNIFYLIIGKFYNSDQLGKYTRADQFNTIFTNNLTQIIQKVSMPVLSSLHNDYERKRLVFRKIIIYSSLLTIPLVLTLAAIAKPLILLLIGEKWLDSVSLLQIMCLYGVLYPLSISNLNILNIEGRSDLFLKLEILKKFLFIPVFAIGYFFTIRIMLLSAMVYFYIEFLCNSYYSESVIQYGTLKQIRDLAPIFIISIIISLIVWSIGFIVSIPVIQLPIQLILAGILYYFYFEKSKIIEYFELKEIINNQVRKILK